MTPPLHNVLLRLFNKESDFRKKVETEDGWKFTDWKRGVQQKRFGPLMYRVVKGLGAEALLLMAAD
ncbi:hypothetical protein [Agrobacterium arsenijevicii]|uniref:Uncharacterized protein n=1 Tax=Agrobacterium arsenijevicii TaxID=1585697 RepID=A0ABR5CZF6_9HYPH|nr:hypothetical protein RP75_28405 [Agrobacterium arsenijevicii]